MNPADLVGYPWEEARRRLEEGGGRWTLLSTRAPERFRRMKERQGGEEYVVRAVGRNGEVEVVVAPHPGLPEGMDR